MRSKKKPGDAFAPWSVKHTPPKYRPLSRNDEVERGRRISGACRTSPARNLVLLKRACSRRNNSNAPTYSTTDIQRQLPKTIMPGVTREHLWQRSFIQRKHHESLSDPSTNENSSNCTSSQSIIFVRVYGRERHPRGPGTMLMISLESGRHQFASSPTSLESSFLPSHLATTGVKATVGGNRTGDKALWAA